MMQLSFLDVLCPPARSPLPGRYGFRVWYPCHCGRTHSFVYLTHPWCMLGLKYHRISPLVSEASDECR